MLPAHRIVEIGRLYAGALPRDVVDILMRQEILSIGENL
jgi:hypothetical protein